MYIADMHCDTISEIYNRRKRGEQVCLLSNDLQIDLKKMQQGSYLLQNFAVFVNLENEENPYQCAKNQIAVFREEMEKNKEQISQVKTIADIRKN